MALTLALVPGSDSTAYAYDGDTKSKLSQAVFSLNLGTYATDGIAIAPTDLTDNDLIHGECSAISAIIFHGPSRDGVHWASYNADTGKILSWSASGTQTANLTDLSTDDKLLHCTILFT